MQRRIYFIEQPGKYTGKRQEISGRENWLHPSRIDIKRYIRLYFSDW